MQKETLPFGTETVDIELPDRATVLRPGEGNATHPSGSGLSELVRAALDSPLGLPRLEHCVATGNKVVIAFDDPTVRTAVPIRGEVIKQALERLAAAGVRDEDVTLICANALHRKWTHDELARVLGQELVDRFQDRLFCHDAEDWDNLLACGQTSGGMYVDVSRFAAEADLCLYVNAGCFMGFSGGWKSIAVGLSTYRSIAATHHPDGMSMSVRHNRMHAILDEMGSVLEQHLGKRFYKVETVIQGPDRVGHVWAGGVQETRAAALEVLGAMNPPRRSASSERYDVVIYGVGDTSPYATYARSNPILDLISSGLGYQGGYIEALGKPGCTVIMANPAPEQWDMEHHPSYREAWDRVLPETTDAYEIASRFQDEFAGTASYIEQYRNGVAFHPVHAILATQPLKRLKHAGRVIVAGADDPAVPQHVGLEAAPSVEAALRMAEAEHGSDCAVVCIRPGAAREEAPASSRLSA